MSVDKLNKDVQEHLSCAKDLKLVIENQSIHPNYQMVMLRSIDLHNKTARKLMTKGIKKLRDESSSKKTG